MALLDSEGFGLSTNINDFLAMTTWSSTGSNPGIGTGAPFGDNYMQLYNTNGSLRKVMLAPATTFFFGVRVSMSGTTHGLLFVSPLNNTQISLNISSIGTITVLRGTSTTLAISAAGALPTSGWHYLEVGAFIDGSAGTFTVIVDGVVVPGLSLTGQNTKGDSSSSQVQVVGFYATNGNSSPICFTHIYWADNTGPAPNNTFLGDVRVQSATPLSNNSVSFTPLSGATGRNMSLEPFGASIGASTGTMYLMPIQAPASGVLSDLRFWSASSASSISVQLGLYSDNSGSPGTLLGSTAVIVGQSRGNNIYQVSSGPTVFSGTTYWVAIIVSGGVNIQNVNDYLKYPPPNVWTQGGVPFASGLPATAAGSLSGSSGISLGMGVSTASNWQNASETEAGTATGTNTSNTVGAQDTFGLQPLSAGLTTVFGVNVKPLMSKFAAGNRTAAPVIVSGATTAVGPALPVPATPAQLPNVWGADPATGAAWTSAAVNALKAGYKILS